MLLVQHRVNDLLTLRQVPPAYGIEVDLRDHQGQICMAHDPFVGGPPFEALLEEYRHALLILNVKSDGMEARLLELMARHRIERFFFLDCANPTLVQLSRRGVRQVAVRYSEFEPIESCLAFAGRVDWVWIDCFTRLPLSKADHARLKDAGFELCLVSPELQRHPLAEIDRYRAQLADLPLDAVCTDHVERWSS